jgi:hypothetical protein
VETLKVIVGTVLPYYYGRFFQVGFSKEPCFPETVIPPTKRISASSTYDNMIQERYIHSSSSFPELPGELNISGTWRWIS